MKIAFVQDGMCFDAGFCPMGDLENTIFRFGHVTKSMVVPFRYGQTDHAGQSKNVDSARLLRGQEPECATATWSSYVVPTMVILCLRSWSCCAYHGHLMPTIMVMLCLPWSSYAYDHVHTVPTMVILCLLSWLCCAYHFWSSETSGIPWKSRMWQPL